MGTGLDQRLSRRAFLHGAIAGLAGLGALALIGPSAAWASAGASGQLSPRHASSKGGGRSGQVETPTWTRVQSEGGPPARRDHSLTFAVDSGLVYLFGGRAQVENLDDLWVFDPATGVWSEVPDFAPGPSARFGHNAHYDPVRKRLLVTLGQAGATFFDDVWAFDPTSLTWSELGLGSPERPQVRYGSGSAFDLLGDRLFISHGFTSLGRFDDTWFFDLATETWHRVAIEGALPEPRCLTRAAWDTASQRLLLFGGQSNTAPFLGDFWTLDPALGVWSQRAPEILLPPPRNLYAASYDDLTARWRLFGGNTASGSAADAWTYDAAADTWTYLDTSPSIETPSPRHSHDLSGIGDTFYLFGGDDGTAELADTWILQLPGSAEPPAAM